MADRRVTVELFGLARHRGGCAELTVAGETVAELLRAVAGVCPGLRDVLRPDGTIARHYIVSVNGERFVAESAEPLPAGSRLLILGADAGG